MLRSQKVVVLDSSPHGRHLKTIILSMTGRAHTPVNVLDGIRAQRVVQMFVFVAQLIGHLESIRKLTVATDFRLANTVQNLYLPQLH